jgi:DNA (cytosine-5)-methyltransferase 1
VTRPKLLDLYCGAGGCSVGYHRAGFDVVGVDIKDQPNYPFEFHRADALEYLAEHWREFDAVHASPPCQAYSVMKTMPNLRSGHPELIVPTRMALRKTGKPYVIENVPGAPLQDPILLCGTMFGLCTADGSTLKRHRYFECSFHIGMVPCCEHSGKRVIGLYGAKARDSARERAHYRQDASTRGAPVGIQYSLADARAASGLDWMTMTEISLAIPPAYTEWIGKRLIEYMESL